MARLQGELGRFFADLEHAGLSATMPDGRSAAAVAKMQPETGR
jgi:hypothetical protein